MAKKQEKIEWDFTTEMCLELAKKKQLYFDPEKSYEITGYLPITETQGLDFDPSPFQEVGADNMRTGKYSGLREGSRGHFLWWEEQRQRCNKGYQVGKYRIPGDYYFFLNFYTMDDKSFEGNKKIHPKFWAAHYAFFHYIEMCEKVSMDGLLLKARGIGGSEIAASLGVGPYTTKRGYQALYTAGEDRFLWEKGILESKAWPNLDYLNGSTENGFAHARSVNRKEIKKAGTLNTKNEEEPDSWGAAISGQSISKPDNLRGDRTNRVFNFKGHPGVNCGNFLKFFVLS